MKKRSVRRLGAILLTAAILVLCCACGGAAGEDPLPQAQEGKLVVVNQAQQNIVSLQIRTGTDEWGRNILEEELEPKASASVKLFGGKDEPREGTFEVLVTFVDETTAEYGELHLIQDSHLKISGDQAEEVTR